MDLALPRCTPRPRTLRIEATTSIVRTYIPYPHHAITPKQDHEFAPSADRPDRAEPLQSAQSPGSAGAFPGDIAPQCTLPALDGRNVDIRADDIAGNPIVLLFCPRFSEAVADALAGVVAAQQYFSAAGARLFAITLDDAKIAQAQNIPFPVLLDSDGTVFRTFDAEAREVPTTVVLRPNQHVMAILKSSPSVQATEALAHVNRLVEERQPMLMTHHPPVLIVPDVLSAGDCRDLITIFTHAVRLSCRPAPGSTTSAPTTRCAYPNMAAQIASTTGSSTSPLQHYCTGASSNACSRDSQSLPVPHHTLGKATYGCYQGERGGELHGHRDNVEPTPYRRFAMSINLNLEQFAGGELRFPEFGDQRYRPPNGTAIVFSSSLLHEALHVTSGRRLVLLAFLFGDH